MAKVNPKEGGKSFPKLSQEDLGDNDTVVVTVKSYEQRTMPDGGMLRELYLEETDKPLRLNKTQCEYLIEALGSDDSDHWVGKKIPIEKKDDVQGPDGRTYNVVWVCAPESWSYIFKEWGGKLAPGQSAPTRAIAKADAKAKPTMKGVKRGGRR